LGIVRHYIDWDNCTKAQLRMVFEAIEVADKTDLLNEHIPLFGPVTKTWEDRVSFFLDCKHISKEEKQKTIKRLFELA